jgi:hypothetical protein
MQSRFILFLTSLHFASLVASPRGGKVRCNNDKRARTRSINQKKRRRRRDTQRRAYRWSCQLLLSSCCGMPIIDNSFIFLWMDMLLIDPMPCRRMSNNQQYGKSRIFTPTTTTTVETKFGPRQGHTVAVGVENKH